MKKSKVEQRCTLGKRASVNQSSNLSSTDSPRAGTSAAFLPPRLNSSTFSLAGSTATGTVSRSDSSVQTGEQLFLSGSVVITLVWIL